MAPLTVLHEGRLLPLAVPASVLVPHVGVVALRVLVLDPSGRGGDGDDVKNNGEEQQQRQDPPAPGVGYPAAKHDRRPEFVEPGQRGRSAGTRGAERRGLFVFCVLAQRQDPRGVALLGSRLKKIFPSP